MRSRRLPKKHTPVDKSVLAIGIASPDYDEKYLAWIRKLPCAVTGRTAKVQAAHIRKGTDGSASKKPSDRWALPLSKTQHDIQHNKWNGSEVSYWRAYGGIKAAKQLCMDLYAVKYDTQKAKLILLKFRIENVLNAKILDAG